MYNIVCETAIFLELVLLFFYHFIPKYITMLTPWIRAKVEGLLNQTTYTCVKRGMQPLRKATVKKTRKHDAHLSVG